MRPQSLSGTTFMLAQFRAIQNILSRDANAIQMNAAQKDMVQSIIEANADPARISKPIMDACCSFMLNHCIQVLQQYVHTQQLLDQGRDSRSREAHQHEMTILFGDVAALYDVSAPFATWDEQLLTTKGQQEIGQAFHRLQQLAQIGASHPVLSQNNASETLILADLLRLPQSENLIVWLSTERRQEVIYCIMRLLLQVFPISSLDIEHGGTVFGELHPHAQVLRQNFTAMLQSIQFHELGSVLRFSGSFRIPRSLHGEMKRSKETLTTMWDGFEEVTDDTGKQYILRMMTKGCTQGRWNNRYTDLVLICWPPLPQHGVLKFHTAALELSITETVSVEERVEGGSSISQGVPRAPVPIGPAMDLIIELP